MKEIITALVKAQGEFLAIKKTKENPFYKSKYADLETCIEATKPALNENGLVVVQTFGFVDRKSTMVTTLYHTSGESVQGVQVLECKDMLDPQKIASCSTYARRYGYMAILGLSSEDDDGNCASKPPVKKVEEPKAPIHNTAGAPVEKKTAPKIDICAEIQSQKYNAEKSRSEYTVISDDGKTIVVYIKKPIVDMMEGSRVLIKGYSQSDYNGKTFHWGDSISVAADDSDIPFGEPNE